MGGPVGLQRRNVGARNVPPPGWPKSAKHETGPDKIFAPRALYHLSFPSSQLKKSTKQLKTGQA